MRADDVYAILNRKIKNGGGGGAGGTNDYNDLQNKPSINGNVLSGALSSESLGIKDGFSPTIQEKTNTETEYVLTITTEEGSFDTPNLKGKDGGGGTGLPLNNCTGITKLTGDKKLKIKWTDPEDIAIEGITLASWAGTKLLRKEDGYPQGERDGYLVADSKQRNQHASAWFTDSGLENGKTYYYKLFPYTSGNMYTNDEANQIEGTPQEIKLDAVTGATATGGDGVVTLKWTDPEDVSATSELDGTTWAGTKVVRKELSAPESPEDGTVIVDSKERNQYKENGFEDTEVENWTKYFYAFYPYSSDGTYGTETVISVTPMPFSKVLAENTWEQIAEASESGIAETLWEVGDEIDITLTGQYNETVTLQIYGFDHDEKTDGSGNAGITFGTKNLLENKIIMKSYMYDHSNAHTTVLPAILECFPENLRTKIKEVKKPTILSASISGTPKSVDCKLFLFSEGEVFGKNEHASNVEGAKYEIFTDDESRIKRLSNGAGAATIYFLRSVAIKNVLEVNVCAVSQKGAADFTRVENEAGVAFGFCV